MTAQFGVRIAAVGLTAVLALPAAAAKDTWIRVQTPHLTIVSNAGEGVTRRVAQRLERFVDAFSAFAGARADPDVPVTVMVFRDNASFAPFRPRRHGETMSLWGYFQRADDENLIALSLDTAASDLYRVIFHEYAHALMARAALLWPLWLQEGVAEFTSTFQSDSRRVALGSAIPEHVGLLRGRPFPLHLLLSANQSLPMAGDGRQQDIFYAGAWALVHYLYAGDGASRRASLDRFMDSLTGQRPDAAFDDAFGTGRASLSEDLHRYIGDGRYVGANVAFERPEVKVAAAVQSVSEADAEVLQGSLLMRIGRGDDAEPHFARAGALDPKAARLEESLGFLALSRSRYEEAKAHLHLAMAQDAGNHLAPYYYAEALRRELMEQGRALPPDVARAMAVPLRRVIALKPSFARAHYLLGYAHLITGEDLAVGARALETAIRLAPPHRAAMLTLSSIQLKMQDYAAAIATAQAIVDSPDASAGVKAEARLVAGTARLLQAGQ